MPSRTAMMFSEPGPPDCAAKIGGISLALARSIAPAPSASSCRFPPWNRLNSVLYGVSARPAFSSSSSCCFQPVSPICRVTPDGSTVPPAGAVAPAAGLDGVARGRRRCCLRLSARGEDHRQAERGGSGGGEAPRTGASGHRGGPFLMGD